MTEPAAHLTEADYLTLLGSVHAIVWRADARTFQTTFASAGAEDVLGYPTAAWTSIPGFWVDHVHPDDRDWVLAFTAQETQAGRGHDFEYRMIAADGRVVWLRNIVNVISHVGQPVELVGVTVEITQRKRAEIEAEDLRNELARVARSWGVGEVAAALAHELNQPLGAIATNAETAQLLARDLAPSGAPLLSVLEDIHQDAHRAGDILHRVYAFLKWQRMERRPISVPALIEGVFRLMRTILTARRVEWTIDIAPSLPPVLADAVQIQQVLVNLIRNAIDAIPENASDRRLMLRVAEAGGPVEVSVSDTGTGIPPGMETRLFEPFATTKAGGLGMGLAISRRIVEGHGGTIRAASRPGGGTTITLTLPIDGSTQVMP